MAYTANTPNANDQINNTQQPIKDNFGGIETAFEVNHGAFGSAFEGKHVKVVMPEQAAAPVPPILENEGALYTKESSSSGAAQTELFFQFGRGFAERELTGKGPFVIGPLEEDGWSFLPSGLLIKFGVRDALRLLSTVTFPVGVDIQFLLRHFRFKLQLCIQIPETQTVEDM